MATYLILDKCALRDVAPVRRDFFYRPDGHRGPAGAPGDEGPRRGHGAGVGGRRCRGRQRGQHEGHQRHLLTIPRFFPTVSTKSKTAFFLEVCEVSAKPVWFGACGHISSDHWKFKLRFRGGDIVFIAVNAETDRRLGSSLVFRPTLGSVHSKRQLLFFVGRGVLGRLVH